MIRSVGLVFFVLATTHSTLTQGHEMRPAYLEINEVSQDVFDVVWKVPARGDSLRLGLYIEFADDVEFVQQPVSAFIGGAHIQKMQIRRNGGLVGTTIRINGLSSTFTDALLRLQRLDGTEITQRLTPSDPGYVVEESPSIWSVAWAYFVIGVEHILFGIDHLLFVLALLLIVGDFKKLLATITAFTIAHSITLALATLGVVHVPGPPVEAIIALSIVFVAAEIIRGADGKPGLTAQFPWIVAFTFGLLHGFGFAGALSEVGLPQKSIPMALLTFNVGVEFGQVLFVGVLVLGYAVMKRLLPIRIGALAPVPAYLIGGVACFWMIERTVGFWY